MYPTYLARIASTAETERDGARPAQGPSGARAVIQCTGPGGRSDLSSGWAGIWPLTDLFSQARVWANIVRTRITGLQTNKARPSGCSRVQYPARDLLPILGDLSREIGACRFLGVSRSQ
jgi:hypothetical protein